MIVNLILVVVEGYTLAIPIYTHSVSVDVRAQRDRNEEKNERTNTNTGKELRAEQKRGNDGVGMR